VREVRGSGVRKGRGGWHVNEVVLRFTLELAASWRCRGGWCFLVMRAMGTFLGRRQEYIYGMRALSTSVSKGSIESIDQKSLSESRATPVCLRH
jgi:hypothetical protein